MFFISFRVNKTRKLVATSNELTHKFSGLITSGLGPDVAYGAARWTTLSYMAKDI
jgi:hypothetical protein